MNTYFLIRSFRESNKDKLLFIQYEIVWIACEAFNFDIRKLFKVIKVTY